MKDQIRAITGKKNVLKVLIGMVLMQAAICTHSQTLADTVRSEIGKINNAYDSAFYLTFDVKMSYTNDPLLSSTDTAGRHYSEVTGTYSFFQNRALYKLGNIEYMQNDSFAIAVYHDDRLILVGRTAGNKSSMVLPNRAVMDTLMTKLELDYIYGIENEDSVKILNFNAIDTTAPYLSIHITYNPKTYYILKIECYVRDYEYDPLTDMEDLPDFTGKRTNVMRFEFRNYRVAEMTDDAFSERKYLFMDGPGELQPSEAYKNFTIYKNY